MTASNATSYGSFKLKNILSSLFPWRTSPVSITERFYQSLENKEYDRAFNCLTVDFQKRIWGGDVEKFKEGYSNDPKISLQSCALQKDMEGDHKVCAVTFNDTSLRYSHPLLEGLPDKNIVDSGEVTERVGSFLKLAIDDMDANPEKAKDTRHRHIASRNAAGKLIFLLDINKEAVKKHFTRKEDTFKLAMRVMCKKQKNGNYKIDGIRDFDIR